MNNTPLSLRTHISIFGNTNAGKSALFNKLLGQNLAIVSEMSGTTTDPVTKAMELIPFGPVAITDTAGLSDTTAIGEKRIKKTKAVLNNTDFALYIADSTDFDEESYLSFKTELKERNLPHLLVFSKSDIADHNLSEKHPDSVSVSVFDESSIENLKSILIQKLNEHIHKEETLIGNLLPPGSTVVLVIPIDSQAPKGRLILPQVQLIRDCLDHNITAVCIRPEELKHTLDALVKTDMVVTDSQIFKTVAQIVPPQIKLTSFSMLLAAQKGDIKTFISGAEAIDNLKDGSKILMAEACTHNVSHEDIGRKKIPAMLKKHTGKQLEFDFYVHKDFPDDLREYDLVIHCGGCMINSALISRRIQLCKNADVPITNYGVAIAYANGILSRSKAVFE